MGYLDDLAGGLKQAGRVFSPAVSEDLAKQEEQQVAIQAQRVKAMSDQLIKGIESGAIPAEQGNLALKKFGYEGVPVGLSPEAQARIAAVQKEEAWQTAAREAGGDPLKLAQAAAVHKPELAATLYNQQENRAREIRRDIEGMDLKRTQIENNYDLKKQALDLAEKQGADKTETQRILAGIQQQRADDMARLGAENNALKGQQLQIQNGLLQIRLAGQANTQNADVAKRAGQMTTALERAELPRVSASLDNVEAAIKNPKVDFGDLTGLGALKPDLAVNSETKAARQSLQQLFNITLKERSGAAVTNNELLRLQKEFGEGAFKTKDQLEGAVARAREIVTKHYQAIAAGYGNDALKFYNDNLEAVGGRPLIRSGGDTKKDDPLGIR